MKFLNFTVITLSLFALVSCAPKSKKKTDSTIILHGASIADGNVYMLYAKNLDQGLLIAKYLSVGTVTLNELPNGHWQFAVVKWEHDFNGAQTATNPNDNEIFTGAVKCGFEKEYLGGGEVSIPLAISEAGCDGVIFGADHSKNGQSQPNNLSFADCTNSDYVDDPHQGSGSESCKDGSVQSFKVWVPEINLKNDLAVIKGDLFGGVRSECVNESTMHDDITSSYIKIPSFDPAVGAHIPLVIETFDSPGCTGEQEDFFLASGLGKKIPGKVGIEYEDAVTQVYLNNNFCKGLNLSSGTATLHGSDYYICSAAQFNAIGDNNANSYKLGSDLDFSATTLVKRTNFQGQLDGNGFQIKNLSISCSNDATDPKGLFNFTSNASLHNLTFLHPSMTLNNDCQQAGFLAGHIFGGEIRDITIIGREDPQNFKDISISNSSGGGLLHFGSAIGLAQSLSLVRDVKVQGVSIDVLGGSLTRFVGGVFGAILNDAGEANVFNVSAKKIDIFTNASTQVEYVGGISGEASLAGGTALNISGLVSKDVKIDVNDGASTRIGGLFGGLFSVDILANSTVKELVLTSKGSEVGGAVGYGFDSNIFNLTVVDSKIFSTATAAKADLGGAIGSMNSSSVASSISDLYVSLDSASGSFIGCDNITNCGGIIGKAQGTVGNQNNFGNLFFEGKLIEGSNVGGIVGRSDYSNYTNLKGIIDIGTPVGGGSGNNIGGVVGNSSFSNYSSTLVEGSIDRVSGVTFDEFVGGIVGTSDNNSTFTGLKLDLVIDLEAGNPTNCHAFDASFNGLLGGSEERFDGTICGSLVASGTNPLFYANTTQVISSSSILNDFIFHNKRKYFNYSVGVPEDPFLISSAEQLNIVGDDPIYMDKFFILLNDLDYSAISMSASFNPIGSELNPFVGFFLGNQKKVKNITHTDASDNGPLGFFRVLGSSTNQGAKVLGSFYQGSVLRFENVHFTQSQPQAVGILAGKVIDKDGADDSFQTEIYNILVDSNSSVTFSANSPQSVGGIIGEINMVNEGSEVSGLFNEASLTSTGNASDIGGVIGKLTTKNINYSLLLNKGNISASSTSGNAVGGIFGTILKTAGSGGSPESISGLKNSGDINASNFSYLGGIVGFAQGDTTNSSGELILDYFIVDDISLNGTIASSSGAVVGKMVTNVSLLGGLAKADLSTSTTALNEGAAVGEADAFCVIDNYFQIEHNSRGLSLVATGAPTVSNTLGAGITGLNNTCVYNKDNKDLNTCNDYSVIESKLNFNLYFNLDQGELTPSLIYEDWLDPYFVR